MTAYLPITEGSISLDPMAFAGAPFQQALSQALGGAPLPIASATRTETPAAVVFTGSATILGVKDAAVSGTLTLDADGAPGSLLVRFTLPGAWTPAASLPGILLPDGFSALGASEAAFVFASTAGPDDVSGQPLSVGLNIVGQWTSSGLQGAIMQAIAGKALTAPFHGTLSVPDGTAAPSSPRPAGTPAWQAGSPPPGLILSIPLQPAASSQSPAWTLGGSGLRLSGARLDLYAPPSAAWLKSNFTWYPDVAIGGTLGNDGGLSADVSISGLTGGLIEVSADFKGVALGSLDPLSNMAGKGDLLSALPEDLRSTLGALTLRSASFSLDGNDLSVRQVIVTVALDPTAKTTTFSTFALENLVANFVVSQPFDAGRSLAVTLEAVCRIGDAITVQVEADTSDGSLSACLAPGTTVDLGSLLQGLGMPAPPTSLTVEALSLLAATNGDFKLGCTIAATPGWTVAIGGTSFAIDNLFFVISNVPSDSDAGTSSQSSRMGCFGGTITLSNGSTFALTIADSAKDGWTIQATWLADDARLGDLLAGFGLTTVSLPDGIELALNRVDVYTALGNGSTQLLLDVDATLSKGGGSAEVGLVVVASRSGDGWTTVLSLDVDVDADLMQLSLLKHALPDLQFVLTRGSFLHTSAAQTAGQAAALNDLIAKVTKGTPPLPAQELPAGFSVGVKATIANEEHSWFIPLSGGNDAPAGDGKDTPAPDGGKETPAADGGKSTPAADVGKDTPAGSGRSGAGSAPANLTLGPLTVSQFGIGYSGGELTVTIQASLTLGGLTLGLTGLSVGVTLGAAATASFGLSGLNVAYSTSAAEIAGDLVLASASPLRLTGTLTAQVGAVGLSAIGAYDDGTGDDPPSLMIYAVEKEPLGGPPYFFVTGLAGGFGYNRSLTPPPVDAVAAFPLVAAARPETTTPAVAPPADDVATGMAKELGVEAGEDWIAAGLDFTSFEVVTSTVLVTVAFGAEFQVALLGTSALALPANASKPVVSAELGLEAVFTPSQGTFTAAGQLTPTSYVFDPACHLTGGFAFYLWFAPSPQADDFVVTLGGYHPSFRIPSHYPVVAPLGIEWKLADVPLSIKGSAYAAFLPHCAMAGGSLQATWTGSFFVASYNAEADFLIQWQPFHYDARMSVNFRVKATVSVLFTTVVIDTSVGASLHLFGPPFSGEATLNLSVFSITLSFGGAQPAQPLDWTAFTDAFLPKRDGKAAPITMRVTGGLLKAAGAQTACVVDQAAAALSVGLFIPASRCSVNPAQPSGTSALPGTPFGIRPMGHATVDSSLTVTVTKDGAPSGAFAVSPVTGNGASALWGGASDLDASLNSPTTISDLTVGLSLRPAGPAGTPAPRESRSLPLASLMDDEMATTRLAWSDSPRTLSGSSDAQPAAVTAAASVNSAQTAAARTAILTDLVRNGFRVATEVNTAPLADTEAAAA